MDSHAQGLLRRARGSARARGAAAAGDSPDCARACVTERRVVTSATFQSTVVTLARVGMSVLPSIQTSLWFATGRTLAISRGAIGSR